MDELVEVHRSRRARKWTLSVPWDEPARLTVPVWLEEGEIERIVETHRSWIARERAKQRPRLRLDPLAVSELEARRAARELVTMVIDDEAEALGVSVGRIQVRDQRTRWGSCSSSGTLSFSWRLVVPPADVLTYVVVHELCHLRRHDHSKAFWALVERALPGYAEPRRWLREHGDELQEYDPGGALEA